MGLLDRLEKEIKEHPLKNENIEKKIQYLNGIAYFISIDNVITNNEREYFLNLIDLLNCNEAKEDLLLFLENPDEQEFKNTFSYLHQNELMIIYLLEIFFTIQNENLNEFENRFIEIISVKYEYTKTQIDTIFEFAKIIQTKDDRRIIEFFKNIQIYEKYLVYLANFYQLNFETKNDLNKIIIDNEEFSEFFNSIILEESVCEEMEKIEREKKWEDCVKTSDQFYGIETNWDAIGDIKNTW